MVSISAERNAHHLKLTRPKLFTDVCHSHAARLLGITDRQQIVDLIGDIQGPAVDPLPSHTSVATKKKLFRGTSKLILSMLKYVMSQCPFVILHFTFACLFKNLKHVYFLSSNVFGVLWFLCDFCFVA